MRHANTKSADQVAADVGSRQSGVVVTDYLKKRTQFGDFTAENAESAEIAGSNMILSGLRDLCG